MKKRKPVKPMFSLKKRSGEGLSPDPIIQGWREVQRALPDAPLLQRLLLLAVEGVPVDEAAPDELPDGAQERIEELCAYLVAAGEITPEELSRGLHREHLTNAFEKVTPFAEGLRTRLDLGDEKLDARLTAELSDEVFQEAWTVVNREFPGPIWDRIVSSAALLYRAIVDGGVGSSPVDELLMDGIHQAFCTWVFERRSEMLTPAEAEELKTFRGPPPGRSSEPS